MLGRHWMAVWVCLGVGEMGGKVRSRRRKLLDDHCSTQAEMGDASLGFMGFMGAVRIMGKSWGVMRYPVGLPGGSGDGVDSITPAAIPRAI